MDVDNVYNMGLTYETDMEYPYIDNSDILDEVVKIFTEPLARMTAYDDTIGNTFMITPENSPDNVLIRVSYDGAWDENVIQNI